MNKILSLSLATTIAITGLNAAEDLSGMFTEGKTSGQIRMFYVDREYQGTKGYDKHRNSLALGGHLKFETAAWNTISAAAAFYTTNGMHGLDYGSAADGEMDPSLLGTGGESYSVLGEAYVNVNLSELGTKTNAKLGYQRYDVPMMGSDDARMLPNTFEAYKLTNADLGNVKFQVAHVHRMAYGTFSNIYGGGILGATSGYPAAGNAGTGKYHNLGQATVGKDTSGVTNAQLKFKSEHFSATVSNDYAWDLYNTLYADAGAKWTCLLSDSVHPFFNAQVIKQNSVGGAYMQNVALNGANGNGEIDSLYWAAKLGFKAAGFMAYGAYSQTGTNTAADVTNGNAYANAIVSQFGGMPAYTQGMVTRHQFMAGTNTMKFVAAYNFKELGTNLSAAAYYTSFDMDANSGYGIERTATEPGFDIKYYPATVEKLQLRFRGNFPRKFAESAAGDLGWNEYRLIANYNF